MINKRTLTVIIRILEECLEHDYSAEELRSKIRDILKLLNVCNHQSTIINQR